MAIKTNAAYVSYFYCVRAQTLMRFNFSYKSIKYAVKHAPWVLIQKQLEYYAYDTAYHIQFVGSAVDIYD